MATWKEYLESKGIDINAEMQEKDLKGEEVTTQENTNSSGEEEPVISGIDSLKSSIDELVSIAREQALAGESAAVETSLEEDIHNLFNGEG